jgi:hypothetical protein
MGKKDILNKILAIIGTLLVWVPILAPVLFSAVRLFTRPVFQIDYLMPAELFPLVLLGGGLLLWAAVLRKKFQRLIGWSLVSTLVLLAGSQGLAVVTGLASGRAEPGGWQWALVLVALAAYILAVGLIGVGGALLLWDLFKTKDE